MSNWISRGRIARGSVLVLAALPVMASAAQNIRIATFNTQGDVSSPKPSGVLPYLATVIEGIGEENYTGDSIQQLPDIVALQETTSNTISVSPLVGDLNAYYNQSNAAYDPYNYSTVQGTTYQNDSTGGGGPSALIYNQYTMNLVATVGVGTPGGSSNGEFRQVMRYEFQPLVDKGTSNGIFYIYDLHSKSGGAGTSDDGTTDGAMRALEANLVRTNTATLPANSSIIYVGDFNGDGTNETAYQTFTASNASYGTSTAGIDPLNPTNNYTTTWGSNNSGGILTEKDTKLEYRDDIQFMTSNIYNGSGNTLHLIPNSYHTFGNNGSVAVNGSVNSGSNTALNDIPAGSVPSSSTVLAAMNGTLGSDHLPVVADYSIVVLANGIWAGGVGNWSNAAMWSNSVVPNSSTIEVKIDNANPVASTVTLDLAATVQDITIDAGDTLNIGAGFSLAISSSVVNIFNGTFSNAGTLSATTVTNTGTFTTTGSFNATGNFTNIGTATFGGTQSWASGSTLNNVAGPVTFNSDAGSSNAANLNVNVSGGSVVFSASQHLASLALASGTTAISTQQASQSNHTLLMTGLLSIAGSTDNWTAVLDLTSNDLDVQNGSLGDVTNQVKQGFNAGQWNGSGGILSSAAAADSAHLTALGVIQNNQNTIPIYGPSNLFDGAAVDAGDILIKFTYLGDANLDGVVDGSDYSLIDNGFLTGATGWFNGDFNYDGVVNGSDYTLIDNAFNMQGASLAGGVADPTAILTAEVAPAVPEPSSLGVVFATCTLLSRRKRGKPRICPCASIQ